MYKDVNEIMRLAGLQPLAEAKTCKCDANCNDACKCDCHTKGKVDENVYETENDLNGNSDEEYDPSVHGDALSDEEVESGEVSGLEDDFDVEPADDGLETGGQVLNEPEADNGNEERKRELLKMTDQELKDHFATQASASGNARNGTSALSLAQAQEKRHGVAPGSYSRWGGSGMEEDGGRKANTAKSKSRLQNMKPHELKDFFTDLEARKDPALKGTALEIAQRQEQRHNVEPGTYSSWEEDGMEEDAADDWAAQQGVGIPGEIDDIPRGDGDIDNMADPHGSDGIDGVEANTFKSTADSTGAPSEDNGEARMQELAGIAPQVSGPEDAGTGMEESSMSELHAIAAEIEDLASEYGVYGNMNDMDIELLSQYDTNPEGVAQEISGMFSGQNGEESPQEFYDSIVQIFQDNTSGGMGEAGGDSCGRCGGKGGIKVRGSDGDMDYDTCPSCNGSGKKSSAVNEEDPEMGDEFSADPDAMVDIGDAEPGAGDFEVPDEEPGGMGGLGQGEGLDQMIDDIIGSTDKYDIDRLYNTPYDVVKRIHDRYVQEEMGRMQELAGIAGPGLTEEDPEDEFNTDPDAMVDIGDGDFGAPDFVVKDEEPGGIGGLGQGDDVDQMIDDIAAFTDKYDIEKLYNMPYDVIKRIHSKFVNESDIPVMPDPAAGPEGAEPEQVFFVITDPAMLDQVMQQYGGNIGQAGDYMHTDQDTMGAIQDYGSTTGCMPESLRMINNEEAQIGDLSNGYGDNNASCGNDYFPTGADNNVVGDAGPASSNQGDNPLQKRDFNDIEVHEDIRESMTSALEAFKKKSVVEAGERFDRNDHNDRIDRNNRYNQNSFKNRERDAGIGRGKRARRIYYNVPSSDVAQAEQLGLELDPERGLYYDTSADGPADFIHWDIVENVGESSGRSETDLKNEIASLTQNLKYADGKAAQQDRDRIQGLRKELNQMTGKSSAPSGKRSDPGKAKRDEINAANRKRANDDIDRMFGNK